MRDVRGTWTRFNFSKPGAWAASACCLLLAGCGSLNSDPKPNQEVAMTFRSTDGSSGGGAAEVVQQADGAGTLKGKFIYGGPVPVLNALSTGGKDAQVCGMSVPNETLVVDDSNKGIADILIYCRKAPEPEGDSPQPVFDQKNCIFTSHVLPVPVGQPVLIKNSDPVAHNTSISPPGDTSINPLLAGGQKITHTFARAQASPVPVTCSIHNWMKAYIIPRGDPYYAVTAKDGAFEIPNVPAGIDLEFQVWHERGAGAGQSLEAKSDWSRGRFTVKIPKDDVLDLGEITVSPNQFTGT